MNYNEQSQYHIADNSQAMSLKENARIRLARETISLKAALVIDLSNTKH